MLFLVLIATVVTFMRNGLWNSEITIWNDAVLKSPNKAGTYYSLGTAYARAGRREEAFLYMRKSIQLDGGSQFKEWLSVPPNQGSKTQTR